MEQLPKPLLEAKIQELIEKEFPLVYELSGDLAPVGQNVVNGPRNYAAKKYAALAIEHLQKDAYKKWRDFCPALIEQILRHDWRNALEIIELLEQSFLPAPPITTKS